MSTKSGSENGFALILTLWVLVILSALLLTFSFAVNLNIKNASYLKKQIDESTLSVGAINCMAVKLIYPEDLKKKKEEEDKDQYDSSSNSSTSASTSSQSQSQKSDKKSSEEEKKKAEWYYDQLGKWYVNTKSWKCSRDKDYSQPDSSYILCNVEAEDSKFPFNRIGEIKSMPNYPDDIIRNIKEKNKSKKNKIICLAQLLEVEGVQGEVFDGDGHSMLGFKNIFTDFSDGKIYVSKTNATVLSFIPKIDLSEAESIASGDQCITSFDDLAGDIGVGSNLKNISEKWLKLTPDSFRIKAYMDINGSRISAEAVVKINKTEIKFLYLTRG